MAKNRCKLFTWDGSDYAPPLKEIIAFARKNPDLKMFSQDEQPDGVLIFAPDIKAARQFITEGEYKSVAEMEGAMGKIVPWKDGWSSGH